MILLNQLVRIPKRATIADDDFHASFFGGFEDFRIARAGIGVSIFFKYEMGRFPSCKKLGEEGLGRFAKQEKFGFSI